MIIRKETKVLIVPMLFEMDISFQSKGRVELLNNVNIITNSQMIYGYNLPIKTK